MVYERFSEGKNIYCIDNTVHLNPISFMLNILIQLPEIAEGSLSY